MSVKLNTSSNILKREDNLNLLFKQKEARHLSKVKENLNLTPFDAHSPSRTLDQKQWKALSAGSDPRKLFEYYADVIRPDVIAVSTNSPKEKIVDFFPLKIPLGLKDLFLRETDYTLENARTGICRGMRDWFLNLLISSLQKASKNDVEANIEAVTQLFEEGGGKAEILLQRLTSEAKKKFTGLKSQPKQRIVDFHENFDEFRKKFDRLKPGIYEYDLHFESSEQKIEGHACVLVKISDQLAYIFDPGYGALRREGNNLAELVFNHAQLTEQVVPLSDIVCSAITFKRVEKKGCSLETLFPSSSFWDAVAKFFSAWTLLFRIFVGLD